MTPKGKGVIKGVEEGKMGQVSTINIYIDSLCQMLRRDPINSFITGRPQVVIPCMEDRAFAVITQDELAMGLPASQLSVVVENLFKSGGDMNIGQPVKTMLAMGLTESITPGFAFLKNKGRKGVPGKQTAISPHEMIEFKRM